jgi:hypothetical protein
LPLIFRSSSFARNPERFSAVSDRFVDGFTVSIFGKSRRINDLLSPTQQPFLKP